MTEWPSIRRAFADCQGRQVHYRHAGTGGVPLLMLHASPASAKQLEPLIGPLATRRLVIAPDRPGNGDSPPLAIAIPEISDYAAAELELLDAMGFEQIDLYGSHTGAFVAVELAIMAPDRVRRVVLDGVGLFTPEQAQEYLSRYAPAQCPDLAGLHLQWVFQFCRDQSLFFPWFRPEPGYMRPSGLPPAFVLHDTLVEVLKSIGTYHLGYNASFRYDARARLPLLRQQVLTFCTTNDPLLPYLAEAASLIGECQARSLQPLRETGAIEALATLLSEFLDQPAATEAG